MQAKRNLAHRMGRWSGTHPWTAILGWMAFVVVSFFIGTSVVTQKTLKQSEQGVGESGRAAKVLDKAFPTTETPAGEMILVQTRSGRLATADLNAVTADVKQARRRPPTVTNIQVPQRSHDGRAALIRFDIRGDSEKAVDKIVPIETAVSAVAARARGSTRRAVRRRLVRQEVRRQARSRTSGRRNSSRSRSPCSSCCWPSARCSRPASRCCSG